MVLNELEKIEYKDLNFERRKYDSGLTCITGPKKNPIQRNEIEIEVYNNLIDVCEKITSDGKIELTENGFKYMPVQNPTPQIEADENKYQGVIRMPKFSYESFIDLTDRLVKISGEKVELNKKEFKIATKKGFEHEYSDIGAMLRVNPAEKKSFKEIMDVLKDYTIIGSAIAGFTLTETFLVGGITYMFTEDNVLSYAAGGIGALLTLVAAGCAIVPDLLSIEKQFFKDADEVFDAFKKNKKKCKDEWSLRDLNGYSGRALQRKLPEMQKQKGITISYESPDHEKIVEFFDFLAEE